MIARSYLFVPGHRARMVDKAMGSGADEVIIDLEDAVPESEKATARLLATDALRRQAAWVRINAVGSDEAEADLRAVGELARGIRIPKVEAAEDVGWVAERLPPGTELLCAVETARGLLAAAEIAASPSVVGLAMGGLDLRTSLGCSGSFAALSYSRSLLVVASRAADLDGPIDSVFPFVEDEDGLRSEAMHARDLGFAGKSAIHPRQLEVIHQVFESTPADVAWAHEVIAALEKSRGRPTSLASGEFVDPPVEARARRILAQHSRAADRGAATGSAG